MQKLTSFLFRQLFNIISWREAKLNILIYHRVMPEPDSLRPWEIDQAQFKRQMTWINGVFNVIPLSQAVEQIKENRLEPRTLAITFDDGYLDNLTVAVPILKAFNYPATFFCTSAWLNGGLMWNDQVIESVRCWPDTELVLEELGLEPLPVATESDKNSAIEILLPKLKYLNHEQRNAVAEKMIKKTANPPRLMMNASEIKSLHQAGMDIGGHTHSHPILARISATQAQTEIQKNKAILEEITGAAVELFAYPNGQPNIDYSIQHSKLVEKANYLAAVSTKWGFSFDNTDLYQLPRFTPWNKSRNRFLANIFKNMLYH